jgi:demethylmenaquinone methyltransferase / 2-methoxy-6-polyprenyl-1,4-benzoquinol methylase
MVKAESKKSQVNAMFDNIAPRYDFLNHLLSFGIDRLWRKKAINIIHNNIKPLHILDVATGTGDLAIASLSLNPDKITGIDISEKMLIIGREKVEKLGLTDKISLLLGDSEKIDFENEVFDVAMVAFGVRNYADPLLGLREMFRVIRKGGMIMVLEFSRPSSFPFSYFYKFYFLNILPLVGRLFSKDRDAYNYLPESVMNFPDNEEFMKLLSKAGFIEIQQKKLSGGIASIYTGKKNSGNKLL